MRHAAVAVMLAFAAFGPPEGGHSVRIVEAAAQKPAPKPPTETDWTALAKLPDFTGVWEVGLGGPPPGRGTGAPVPPPFRGGRGRAGGSPAGPQLTSAYAEKRRANLARGAEDNQTAN